MKNNTGEHMFCPTIQRKWLLYVFFMMIIVLFFMRGRWDTILICLFGVAILICLILMLLQPKTSYIKIQEHFLIVGGLDIPSFKIVEKCIQYNDIESINMLYGFTNSVHIKEKDQEKKIAMDGFSKESFNEIKDILIGKGLHVSVSTMNGSKREVEDFNKDS